MQPGWVHYSLSWKAVKEVQTDSGAARDTQGETEWSGFRAQTVFPSVPNWHEAPLPIALAWGDALAKY